MLPVELVVPVLPVEPALPVEPVGFVFGVDWVGVGLELWGWYGAVLGVVVLVVCVAPFNAPNAPSVPMLLSVFPKVTVSFIFDKLFFVVDLN